MEMAVKIPSKSALAAVREQMGPFNWVLLAPTEAGKELVFVNAGSLSVNGACVCVGGGGARRVQRGVTPLPLPP
jgi:hypothetical protein